MSTQDSPLARKLGNFVALSEKELAVLAKLHQRRRTFIAGKDLVHQGQVHQSAYILADGWVCSHKRCPAARARSLIFRYRVTFWGCGASCSAPRITISNQ